MQELYLTSIGQEDVGRFDVAVDDPFGVGRVERVSKLRTQLEHIGSLERMPPQMLAERHAPNHLHDEKRLPLMLADVVQRADVRVVELRDRPRFPLEPLAAFGIVGEVRRQDLDGDGPVQPGVGRLVDLAHATRAIGGEDLVRSKTGARGECHVVGGMKRSQL